jgi:hypothetical protein
MEAVEAANTANAMRVFFISGFSKRLNSGLRSTGSEPRANLLVQEVGPIAPDPWPFGKALAQKRD